MIFDGWEKSVCAFAVDTFMKKRQKVDKLVEIDQRDKVFITTDKLGDHYYDARKS